MSRAKSCIFTCHDSGKHPLVAPGTSIQQLPFHHSHAMSEHWKSTPSYWCKFCSTYVRDTSIERKNHEASAKHQNNIRRNLRDLQKNKQREERERQRAKDEVARLNGLVDGTGGSKPGITGFKDVGKSAAPQPTTNAAQQRRVQAEQLLAMGVKLPEELQREVTGVSDWHTVSERVIEDQAPRSLADIKAEVQAEEEPKPLIGKGVHKRKAEEGEEEGEKGEEGEEAAPRSRAWGSEFKAYPGARAEEGEEDLDALLSGVGKKKPPEVKEEDVEVKKEEVAEDEKAAAPVKQEEGEEKAAPAVVFKKRKVKK
jgi:hypothetical protein